MILVVCMNPAIDRISEADCLRRQNVKKIKTTAYSAGGKGINAARVLKALGADSLTVGFSGGHAGRFFEALLESEGLDGEFAQIKGITRMNATLLDAKGRGEMHIVDRGPAVEAEEAGLFRDLFMRAVDGGKFACALFCGSLPPGVPQNFYRGLISAAKKRGLRTAMDSSGRPLQSGIRAKPDIIKPNSRELDELAGVRLKKIGEKTDFALKLEIPETVVSMGRRGSFAVSGKEIFRALPLKTPCVNSVGAGDAMLAGYVFSRVLKKESIEKALLKGAACAQASLSSRMPGRIAPENIEKFEKRLKLKRLKTWENTT